MDLGQVQLKRGNTAEALASWNEFLDCADGVQSVCINDALGNITARLPLIPEILAAAQRQIRDQAREPEERITPTAAARQMGRTA
ncbi:hypothetical protein ACFVRD_48935 [Streptomyces sp. NPDC057908]|uniref:hypothetical protein n=1 Tax=Streptomyces sp. NPDC057908 TaxID=3346276 RepID=UPI0036EAC33F